MPQPLRVAVVGAGPSGLYTAEALTSQATIPIEVDVFDRLPTPYGLVRYGVAPDHLRMKTVEGALAKVFERDSVRFFGNVDVGRDVSVAEFAAHYHAVVWCYGAATDRRLGIPGEGLAGSTSAARFVNWYCGHPDSLDQADVLGAHSVAVIGNGNVAVDIARILAKDPRELRATDMHAAVLMALDSSAVTDIHVIGRGSPARAKWTTKELRELGELADADVVLDPADLVPGAACAELLAGRKDLARNLEVLREWAGRPVRGSARRVHLRFFQRPVEVLGPDRVSGLVLERTELNASGQPVGTGRTSRLPVQAIVRAAGYLGASLPGLPYDPQAGTVPHLAGRVLSDGHPVPGHYVAGWIKRGPSGIIGTNRSDAAETVRSLLSDAAELAGSGGEGPAEELTGLLARLDPITWDEWLAIESAEIDGGAAQGRHRVKIAAWDELLGAARGAAPVSRGSLFSRSKI